MTATVYLHPRAVELNLFAVCSQLKTRGFEVPRQPGQRFLIAVPEQLPPPVRPPPSAPMYPLVSVLDEILGVFKR